MKRLGRAPVAAILTVVIGGAATTAGAAGDAGLVVAASRPSPWAVTFSADTAGDDAIHTARLTRSTIDLSAAASVAGSGQDPAGPAASADDQGTARTTAFVYSDAYQLRRKIHFIASFATIPLFAAEYALGAKLYDGTGTSSTRSAHQAVGAGIGVLFGVNTVTGVWNMIEARKDPNGRAKRLAHSFLMLAADAGFVATAALAPDDDGEGGSRSMHRTVALTSVALATTGYLIMLFGR